MANVWINPNEIDGNGIDDDNNGFIDDIHGWNFDQNMADPTGPIGSAMGRHGTHVAGVAVAVTNNRKGIAGSSWNAQFMAINTSCPDQLFLCNAFRGVVYASMNGADVITASYGSYMYSQTEELVMQAALDQGALVVAASGNRTVNVDVQPPEGLMWLRIPMNSSPAAFVRNDSPFLHATRLHYGPLPVLCNAS